VAVNRSTLKYVSLAVMVLVLGAALRSIDALANTQVWHWSLGDVVGWASFTVAAATGAFLAGEVATRPDYRLLGSPGLSRLGGVILLGIALWLLHAAVKPVLVSDFTGIAQKTVAFGIVALAAYAVWVAYSGFDEIAAAIHSRAAPAVARASSPAPSSGAAAPGPMQPRAATDAFCGKCGAPIQAGNLYCGRCGAVRPDVAAE
jgi:hypothetical protein